MSRLLLILSLLIGLGTVPSVQAQEISPEDFTYLQEVEDTLGLLSYAIVNDSLPENRFGAVQAFIPALVRALKRPNSFQFPFSQVQSVSIQYPADSSFRVFTIQLYVDKDEYRYYGAIQMNTPDLQLFPLIDRSFEFTGNLEQAVLPLEQWYGVVYYKVITVTEGPQPHYLLFGFDGYEYFRKRKIIEVLTFQEGRPVFGAPVFLQEETEGAISTQQRVVLEYSVEASVRCNYDEAFGFILFDHLQSVAGTYGEGPVNIPDGTYEGYRLQDGRWQYIEKVFNQVLDEAPRPEPVLDGRQREILGRGGQ